MRRALLVAVVALCAALAWAMATEKDERAAVTFPDGAVVRAEIADSSAERSVGLSQHAFLDPDRGMLFLFDEPTRATFWMIDMDFPIDIIWILDETVVGIESSVPVPVPGIGISELPTYTPESPVNRVLEVNAGFAEAHGLVPGDRLDIDLP